MIEEIELKTNNTKNVLTVITAAFMSFVGILTETSLNVIFPTLMKEFKVSLDVIQWTTTGYLLAISIVMISSSYLNRRFTAKQLFMTACIGFMTGSLISAFAPNFELLLAGRLISALGVGISGPLMFNLIVEILPRSKWGFYMGIAGLVIAMAPTLGPAFGGAVNYYLNWRLIFIIVTIFDLIVFLIGIFVFGKYHEQEKIGFDWLNYLILSVALITLTVGINQISKGLSNYKLWLLLLVSAALFYLFIKNSKRSKKSLIDLSVFKNKAFVFGLIAYFLLQLINIGTSFVLPNYVQIVDKQSSLIGGLILLPGSIISGLLNPYFGRLYDKFGAKLPLYLGGTIFALGTFLFAILGLKLTAIMIIFLYGVLMLGHKMSFSNTMAEALKVQDDTLRSDATAVCQTGQQLAGSVGTTILAAIISIWQNKGGASYAYLTAQGSQVAFYFTFVLSIVIILCDWRMFKLEK